MYICEQCGKEVYEPFGSGRFCSRSCSNKWVALHQSAEAKARKIEAGKDNLRHDNQLGRPHTDETRQKISETLLKTHVEHPEIARSISEKLKGRKLPDEVKLKCSRSLLKAIEEGRHPGWSRPNRNNSYPNQYWSKVLDSYSIKYEREYKVLRSLAGLPNGGCWYLDFYIEPNIDLEIDGSQHDSPWMIDSDRIRDSYLSSLGYVVYRIKWCDPKNTVLMNSKVKEFLEFYNSMCSISSTVE